MAQIGGGGGNLIIVNPDLPVRNNYSIAPGYGMYVPVGTSKAIVDVLIAAPNKWLGLSEALA